MTLLAEHQAEKNAQPVLSLINVNPVYFRHFDDVLGRVVNENGKHKINFKLFHDADGTFKGLEVENGIEDTRESKDIAQITKWFWWLLYHPQFIQFMRVNDLLKNPSFLLISANNEVNLDRLHLGYLRKGYDHDYVVFKDDSLRLRSAFQLVSGDQVLVFSSVTDYVVVNTEFRCATKVSREEIAYLNEECPSAEQMAFHLKYI